MDASNKFSLSNFHYQLSLILGTHKIPADELGAEEWLKIINATLKICKPYLKYLSGFKTIDEISPSDETLIEEEFDERTRCIKVVKLEDYRDSLDRCHDTAFLLLTREGRWLCWEQDRAMTESCFVSLGKDDLFKMLFKNCNLGIEIFNFFLHLVNENLNERRGRLQQIERLRYSLDSIKSRIRTKF